MQDFVGAYGECMYLLDWRFARSFHDAVASTECSADAEMRIALDADVKI